MRFFALALALISSAAVAAPQCQIPGLPKITGQSYHLARGQLIAAGFLPRRSADFDAPRDAVGPFMDDARALGYIEAGQPSQGSAARSFSFSAFTVHAIGCESLTSTDSRCTVRRVSCNH